MKSNTIFITTSVFAFVIILSAFRFSEPRFDPNQVVFRFVQRTQTGNIEHDFDEFVYDNLKTESQTRLYLNSDSTFLWKHNSCTGGSLSSGNFSVVGDTLILSSDSTMTKNYFEDYTSNNQSTRHIKPSLFQMKFFIERNSETAEMKNLIAIR